MSVSPEAGMFSHDAPEMNEDEAVKEIMKELQDIQVSENEISDIVGTLKRDPDGIYSGHTKELDFTVLLGFNGRFLLKFHKRNEGESH